MATGKNGTLTWTNGNFSFRLEWSETYNATANTSSVTVKNFSIKAPYAYDYYPDGKIYVNGVCVWELDSRVPTCSADITSSGTYASLGLSSKTVSDIAHKTDGTKTVAIKIAGNRFNEFCLFSGTGSNNGEISASSQSIALTTIAKSSTISVSTLTMGISGTITVSKANSSFKNTIKYYWGDTSAEGLDSEKGYRGTIISEDNDDGYEGIIDSTTGNVTWSPKEKLANAIPNATSGTGTLLCITTNKDGTEVGRDKITFTCKVPSSMKPTLDADSFTVTPDNSANSIIKGWGEFVVGFSKAKLVAKATGSYSSTISSFVISGAYNATKNGKSLSYTGEVLTSSGTKSFTLVTKDSRSRSSSSATKNITVYSYNKPTIAVFKVNRTNASKINVKCDWKYSTVGGKNTATPTLYYKLKKDTSWTKYGEIEKNKEVTLNNNFDEAKSYNFRLVVEDSLGNQVTKETDASTISVLLDFKAGGKGLGVGKIAELDDYLDVSLKSIFRQNVQINNNKSFNGTSTNGTVMRLINVNSNDNTLVGYGSYSEEIGGTHIYGNEITFYTNDYIHSNRKLKVLWSGTKVMTADETVSLSENVSSQINGIVLHWVKTDEASNRNQNIYHFIPKSHILYNTSSKGDGTILFLCNSNATALGIKCVHILNSSITGNSVNDYEGSDYSLKLNSAWFALSEVLGV